MDLGAVRKLLMWSVYCYFYLLERYYLGASEDSLYTHVFLL